MSTNQSGSRRAILTVFAVFLCVSPAPGQRTHVPGESCTGCHPGFGVAGTVFNAYAGGSPAAGSTMVLLRPDGGRITLPPSDSLGRVHAAGIPDGGYLPVLAGARARSWHLLPAQADCNTCHIDGGNGSALRTKQLHRFHTELPADNTCTPCHFFPASMSYNQLRTPGRLNSGAGVLPVQGSAAVIRGTAYPFAPEQREIRTVRPDIFTPGYYSLFDVLLTVARDNGIRIAYHWDPASATHFIDSVDGVAGDYWHRFSYDAGSGTQGELGNRRELRWDELLYQPGSWVQLVAGENLDELRREFREEITREAAQGHRVPVVQIAVNPSQYRGNPPGSGRITVQRTFTDVAVTSHGMREHGRDSLHSMPFRPGVVTAMDVLYSLQDSGKLSVVGKAYYTRLAQKVQESWRIQEIGFPGLGSAHGSGRQGFVYTTGNGTPQRMANNADRKQHVHADIVVLHAPDFAQWRWIELGNPYYEDGDPTGLEELVGDFDARDKGFRLHHPYPQPGRRGITLPFNVFEPGVYRLVLYNTAGERVATLFDSAVDNIGLTTVVFDARGIPAGLYYARLDDGHSVDVQRLLLEGGR